LSEAVPIPSPPPKKIAGVRTIDKNFSHHRQTDPDHLPTANRSAPIIAVKPTSEGESTKMAKNDSFIHLARPLPGQGATPTTAPITVNIQPSALFSILDHSLRRNPDQERVIGTLLGVRSEDGSEVEVRSCYAVPHTETTEQVEVDMEFQKQMLALHLRQNPREVLIGWYATSSELNTFSALIQNFYSGSAPPQGEGTWPHPAVHLTVSTIPGQPIVAQTYISAPIGVTEERSADSCLFIPVPHEIKYSDADRSGLELIASAKDKESRAASVEMDLDSLERSLLHILDMLERVSNYVSNVLDEEAPPSNVLGQYLMNALSLAPKVDPANIERDL
jgi:translation initiation factor 3 subunit F